MFYSFLHVENSLDSLNMLYKGQKERFLYTFKTLMLPIRTLSDFMEWCPTSLNGEANWNKKFGMIIVSKNCVLSVFL